MWLTPDTAPGDFMCRALFIPKDVKWLAAVSGALGELAKPHNWEDFGSSSPQDTAGVYSEMFRKFLDDQGPCRMIGEIILWSTSTSPLTGWLICDGSSLLRTEYPDLFAVISDTYGAADVNHFSLPDLRGRVAIGIGQGTGLTPRALGDAPGEEAHTLIVSETPAHAHTDTGHTHSEGTALPAIGAAIVGVPIPSAVPSLGVTGVGFAGISNTGGDGSHNNIQPSLALNYLIVAK